MHKEGYFSKNRKFCRLIKNIAAGKKSALREFYELYGKGIYALALSVCRTPERADEAVNEVLLKVWDAAGQLLNYENPDGWLYRVIENAAKLAFRAKEWLPLPDGLLSCKDDFQAVDDGDAFARYTEDLTENERSVVILRIVEDMTFEDIAAVTGRPQSSVSTLYYRALEKIKKKIEKSRGY